jgi:hypothetical protein
MSDEKEIRDLLAAYALTLDVDDFDGRLKLFIDSSTHEFRPALYDDDLARSQGRWRFRRRRCQFLTTKGLSDRPQEQS